MKLVAGWFGHERGFPVGVVVGALTVGAALPFLFRGLGAMSGLDWHAVVAGVSVAGVLGGLIVATLVCLGLSAGAQKRQAVAKDAICRARSHPQPDVDNLQERRPLTFVERDADASLDPVDEVGHRTLVVRPDRLLALGRLRGLPLQQTGCDEVHQPGGDATGNGPSEGDCGP